MGIFTGPSPVVYIPVIRTMGLSRIHESLCEAIAPLGSDVSDYYTSRRWAPHITLAQFDVGEGNLPKIVWELNRRRLDLTLRINNVALNYDDGKSQTVRSRFRFLD